MTESSFVSLFLTIKFYLVVTIESDDEGQIWFLSLSIIWIQSPNDKYDDKGQIVVTVRIGIQ